MDAETIKRFDRLERTVRDLEQDVADNNLSVASMVSTMSQRLRLKFMEYKNDKKMDLNGVPDKPEVWKRK